MTFQDDVIAAQQLGRPFATEHNVTTGKSSVVFLTGPEIAAGQQRRKQRLDAETARQQAEAEALAARDARLEAAIDVAALRQFIKDELL